MAENGFTGFTKVQAELVKGGLCGAVQLSKSDSYALTAAERAAPYVGCTMSEASKVLTLGLQAGQIALVSNEGTTNAVTVKNVSGDTGTSLDAGKIALVVGSVTANETKVFALN